MDQIRITTQTLLVLEHFVSKPSVSIHGFEIIDATDLQSGTVYPVLARLERAGWLSSEWDTDPDARGARRRLYRVTPDGLASARYELAKARATADGAFRLRPGWAT